MWCLALVARADGGPSSDEGAFKPAAPLRSLMYGQVQHFKAMGELLESKNVPDRTERLIAEAGVLAELANVNVHHKDKPDYKGWARQVRDLSLAFATEAKKDKDASPEKLESLRQNLKDTCMACHDVYR